MKTEETDSEFNARKGIDYSSVKCEQNYVKWSKKVRDSVVFESSAYNGHSYVSVKAFGYMTVRANKPKL